MLHARRGRDGGRARHWGVSPRGRDPRHRRQDGLRLDDTCAEDAFRRRPHHDLASGIPGELTRSIGSSGRASTA